MVKFLLGIAGISARILGAIICKLSADRKAATRARRDIATLDAERAMGRRHPDRRFLALVESGDSVIVGLAPDHRIVTWNRAAEDIYGVSESEVLGKDYLVNFLTLYAFNRRLNRGRFV